MPRIKAAGPRKRSGKGSLQARIEREKAAHKRRYGSLPIAFLNNFHGRLPGGFLRKLFEEEDLQRRYEDPRASRKLRGMTAAQFFALIDNLIPEVGLDPKTIVRLQDARTGEIYDYVYPLYLRLREAGFKHYPDLTA